MGIFLYCLMILITAFVFVGIMYWADVIDDDVMLFYLTGIGLVFGVFWPIVLFLAILSGIFFAISIVFKKIFEIYF